MTANDRKMACIHISTSSAAALLTDLHNRPPLVFTSGQPFDVVSLLRSTTANEPINQPLIRFVSAKAKAALKL
jgi:hypothetical protein